MLPALCLRCGASGSRERQLEDLRAGPVGAPRRTGYYCEACDEQDRAWSTRAFAARMSLGITLVAVSASVLFFFGEESPLSQGLIVMLVGASATAVLEWWFSRRRPKIALFRAASQHADGLLFLPDTEGARAMARALEPKKAERTSLSLRSVSASTFAPLALSLGLLTLAHTTLDATLVVLDAEGDGSLLVDHRLRARTPSLTTESPSRLTTLRIFSGSRHLTWIGPKGGIRFDQTVSIEPGQVALLASPPAGQCLFLESQSYGASGADHFLTPLGPGPVHQLVPPPEHWLRPIPPAEPTASRGGAMTALRLLPCSAN